MNARLAALAGERELLVARSTLCRLRFRHQKQALREAFRWRRTANAVAAVVRIGVVAKLALSVLGHARTLFRTYGSAPTPGRGTR